MHRHGGKEVVASFATVPEAEVAAAALRANGFEALITADDCAGMDGFLRVLLGVHVVVPEEDAAAARDCLVLLGQSDSESADETEATLGSVPYFRRRPVFWTVAVVFVGVNLLAFVLLLLEDLFGF